MTYAAGMIVTDEHAIEHAYDISVRYTHMPFASHLHQELVWRNAVNDSASLLRFGLIAGRS
jgi:hypothetical protein